MNDDQNRSNPSDPSFLNEWQENGVSRNGSSRNGSKTSVVEVAEPSQFVSAQTLVPRATPAAQPDEWSHVTRDLLDALPRVWTRGLLYFLVFSAGILLPWAVMSKVEETGTARGLLEPQGKILQLDAPVSGTVADVKLEEGNPVKAGQVILELESDVMRSDLHQAESKLEGLLDRQTQLDVIKSQLEVVSRSQRLQNQAQITAQKAQIDQTQQEIDLKQSTYKLNQELLVRAKTTLERLQDAHQQGVVSLLQLEDAERSFIENQKLLEQTYTEIQHAKAEQVRQQSTYESLVHEGEVTLLENQKQIEELQAQLIDIQAEVTQTKSQIQSLQLQLQQRILKSPIDGVLFQLPIKGPSAVVQPGELVAEIAPQNTPLILKTQMPSQESGFLRVGMPAKVKFDAYPFQDYGIIHGHVSWISPDSKKVQVNQGEIEVFDVNITLDQHYIQTANKRIMLTPGQTATAEVIVRQRRIIDFVLDPFKKLQQGGLDF